MLWRGEPQTDNFIDKNNGTVSTDRSPHGKLFWSLNRDRFSSELCYVCLSRRWLSPKLVNSKLECKTKVYESLFKKSSLSKSFVHWKLSFGWRYVLLKERNMVMTMEEEYKRNCELFPNSERLEKVRKNFTLLKGNFHLFWKWTELIYRPFVHKKM